MNNNEKVIKALSIERKIYYAFICVSVLGLIADKVIGIDPNEIIWRCFSTLFAIGAGGLLGIKIQYRMLKRK